MKLTKEEFIQLINNASNQKEFIVKDIPPKKFEYDFSKVNLNNFSKKQLIKIILELKERLDIIYETN